MHVVDRHHTDRQTDIQTDIQTERECVINVMSLYVLILYLHFLHRACII